VRRVVVTGLGLVTPLGVGVAHVWGQLLEGKSGIRPIHGVEVSDLATKIGGQVPPPASRRWPTRGGARRATHARLADGPTPRPGRPRNVVPTRA
jgi:3-oxoacyl-(acyl-carrier-protein) synthase